MSRPAVFSWKNLRSLGARALVFLPLLAGFSLPAPAQGQAPPDPVSAGKFEGTWYRVEGSGLRQGIQLRRTPDGGSWEMRFYWWVIGGFSFDTEWTGSTEYSVKDWPARVKFSFVKEKSTADRLVFQWRREQNGPRQTVITEEGEGELFRSGLGDSLVFRLDPLTVTQTVGEPLTPDEEHSQKTTRRVLIFMKAAHRLINWDEVPW